MLSTMLALPLFNARMLLHVHHERAPLYKIYSRNLTEILKNRPGIINETNETERKFTFSTNVANVWSDSSVISKVELEVAFLFEMFPTVIAKERSISGVGALMIDKMMVLDEGLFAVATFVFLIWIMGF